MIKSAFNSKTLFKDGDPVSLQLILPGAIQTCEQYIFSHKITHDKKVSWKFKIVNKWLIFLFLFFLCHAFGGILTSEWRFNDPPNAYICNQLMPQLFGMVCNLHWFTYFVFLMFLFWISKPFVFTLSNPATWVNEPVLIGFLCACVCFKFLSKPLIFMLA